MSAGDRLYECHGHEHHGLTPTRPRTPPLESSLVEVTRGRLDYLERLATRYEALIEQLTARVAVLEKRTAPREPVGLGAMIAPREAITMAGGSFAERDTLTVYQREKHAAGVCLVAAGSGYASPVNGEHVSAGLDCHRPITTRGLCKRHAKNAANAVNRGETTWAAMEAAGKCLPKQSRAGAARKWLAE